MKKHLLWPFFLISLFFTLYSSAFLSYYTLLPFSPFLVMTFNQLSFSKSLWLSIICGLLIDLLSNFTPFGFHALNYTIITFFIHRFRFFFREKALGLSSFTIFFSLSSTLLEQILLPFFGLSLPLSWKGVIIDFFFMPLLDGFYAFLCFSSPLMLYYFLRQKWFHFLFFRKETKKKKEKLVR